MESGNLKDDVERFSAKFTPPVGATKEQIENLNLFIKANYMSNDNNNESVHNLKQKIGNIRTLQEPNSSLSSPSGETLGSTLSAVVLGKKEFHSFLQTLLSEKERLTRDAKCEQETKLK